MTRVLGQIVPRRVDVELVVLGERLDQLEIVLIAPIPAAHGAGGERQLRIDDDARRIEELRDAETIAAWASTHRRVEREQARLELGQRVIADRAREARRERRLGGFRIVEVREDRDTVAEAKRRLERFGEPLLDVFARPKAVDDGFDRVLLAQRQRRHRVELVDLAVDARAHEALRAQLLEDLHMLALALAHDRREQHEACFGIEREHRVDHLADGLRFERNAVLGTARRADAREQQAQVIVDLGDRADGRARIVRRRLLLDRDRGRKALDVIDVGLLHHRQELPRVRRQRLDVAALPFGVDRVERERGFARTGEPGDHDQLVAREIEIDVLEIVRARTANADRVHRRQRWGDRAL